MAIVQEMSTGRRLGGQQRERQFKIALATGEQDARDALVDYIDENSLTTLDDYTFSVDDSEVEEAEPHSGLFIGHAVWKAPGNGFQGIGNFSLNFDISGQTQKITQALSTIQTYKATSPAGGTLVPDRDFQNAINVNEDGSIDGVDIIVPTWTFGLTYYMSPAAVNEDYVSTLKSMVGKVNSDAFNGFAAGELLFTKVSGSRGGGEFWKMDFGWSVSENDSDLTVSPLLTGISKDGWDLCWCFYGRTEDTTNHLIYQQPKYATVVRVYKRVAYSRLGLPEIFS